MEMSTKFEIVIESLSFVVSCLSATYKPSD